MMANRQKNKGARYERAAVDAFVELYPQLVDVKNPARLLGEGRKEDGGDLNLFSDTTVQVKAWNNMGAGIRAAATTVVDQAEYADKPFSVGMVPINGARKDTVAWVMCCLPDMMPSVIATPIVRWARISDLTAWLRDDVGPKGFQPYPRHQRIAELSHASAQPVWCFPMETFVLSLATARGEVHNVGEELVL